MKKILSIMLAVSILISAFTLVSADGETVGFSYNSNTDLTASVAQQTGLGVNLGSTKWRSVNADEGLMGGDASNPAPFEVKNYALYIYSRNSGRGNVYLRYNNGDTNIPALVYNTPSKYLTGDQTIEYTSYWNHGTCSGGVRFKVHNNGQNYYAVVFGGDYIQPNNGGSDKIAYKIYKVVNGSISGFKEVKFANTGVAADNVNIYDSSNATVRVSCLGDVISFTVTQGDRTWSDSWTDPSPFTFASNDTATVWFTAAGANNDSRFVKFSNIQINCSSTISEQYDDGLFKYNINAQINGTTVSNTSATVIGFSDSASSEAKKDIVIPASVTVYGITYPVTALGEGAFRASSVETVVLPDSITTLSNNVFRACDRLSSINIPASVTNIPNGAFYKVSYNTDGLDITFEGNTISFAAGEDWGDNRIALSIADYSNKKINAIVSHPGAAEAVGSYFAAKNDDSHYRVTCSINSTTDCDGGTYTLSSIQNMTIENFALKNATVNTNGGSIILNGTTITGNAVFDSNGKVITNGNNVLTLKKGSTVGLMKAVNLSAGATEQSFTISNGSLNKPVVFDVTGLSGNTLFGINVNNVPDGITVSLVN